MQNTMTYRNMKTTGDNLSLLGYGCMRFPRKGAGIDEARAKQQVLAAIEGGVNYFDTAYLYPGSEKALGNILSGGLRETVKVATKLPPMLVKNRGDMDTLLQKQLDRLQTGYIDYYLLHNLVTLEDWERLRSLGVIPFLEEARNRGKIRHIGFSFHGNVKTFREIVDAYPWDFCQIQYNYLDEHFQAGTSGLEYAAEKGLGIIVMEPLRGGTLGAGAMEPVRRAFEGFEPRRSPAEWALRWVFSHPQVHVVLSGMNEETHVAENLRIASDPAGFSLSDGEQACIDTVRKIFSEKIKVPCTGCAYCMPCPHGVDIPSCFAQYNNRAVHGGLGALITYINATEGAVNGKPSRASLCKNCGACTKHCPQQIDIPRRLGEVAGEMERAWLRIPVRTALRLASRGSR